MKVMIKVNKIDGNNLDGNNLDILHLPYNSDIYDN